MSGKSDMRPENPTPSRAVLLQVFEVAKTLSDDDCLDDEWDAAWDRLKELCSK